MDPSQLTSWWSIARDIGAGATFILGIASYCLWARLSSEQDYSRQRDKETLEVLNSLGSLVTTAAKDELNHTDKVLTAITTCQQTIIQHLDRIQPNRNP